MQVGMQSSALAAGELGSVPNFQRAFGSQKHMQYCQHCLGVMSMHLKALLRQVDEP
jgi:hypothetical protein